jgi:nicotinate-nucleotide--dimethylbenzimidazole phosphoribosyltransferase
MDLSKLAEGISSVNEELGKEVQARLDNLTKPLGSLGKLEETAKKVALAFNDANAKIKEKCIIVFAADHGIADESVSLFPKEVTTQMVYNFLNGGAGINVLARHVGADVIVMDIGVDTDFQVSQNLVDMKVAKGTKNMLKGPAMSEEEAMCALKAGYVTALDLIQKGYNVIGLGEMGIGNTTAASAVTSVITGLSPEEVTGRGTGIDDAMLSGKVDTIKKVIDLNSPDKSNAVDILQKVGGFELGGIAGACLACAENRALAVIDGFISTAGAALAYLISPKVGSYMVASHNSVERGHRKLLQFMGLTPVLDLDLRLGEGTGAALCMNIMEASSKILNEMATFESANVSTANNGE